MLRGGGPQGNQMPALPEAASSQQDPAGFREQQSVEQHVLLACVFCLAIHQTFFIVCFTLEKMNSKNLLGLLTEKRKWLLLELWP